MESMLQRFAGALLCLALLGPALAASEDGDGDGVPDGTDQCPDSRAGTLIDPRGCAAEIPPLPSADADDASAGQASVPVAEASPTAPGASAAEAAPAEAAPVPAAVTPVTVTAAAAANPALRNLVFESESFKLGGDNRRILDGIYASLRRDPALRLEIVGHADREERLGRVLAQARAAAARAFLVDLGIDGSRLQASGAGSKTPLAASDSEAGRALNRRVEFRVLSQ